MVDDRRVAMAKLENKAANIRAAWQRLAAPGSSNQQLVKGGEDDEEDDEEEDEEEDGV